MKTKERVKVHAANAWEDAWVLRHPKRADCRTGPDFNSWLLISALAGISREVDENKGTGKVRAPIAWEKLGASDARTLPQAGGVVILTPGFCSLKAFHTEVTEKTRPREHGSLLFLRELCYLISVPSVRTFFSNRGFAGGDLKSGWRRVQPVKLSKIYCRAAAMDVGCFAGQNDRKSST